MEIQQIDLFFVWQKPSIGYMWEECEPLLEDLFGRKFDVPPSPYLVEKDYSQGMAVYQPLEDSTVFTTFADLEPTFNAYAQWASDYGQLVWGEKIQEGSMIKNLIVFPSGSIDPKKTIHHSGFIYTLKDGRKGYGQLSESSRFWRKEHEDLSFAFLLWELATLRDTENLKKIVQWDSVNPRVIVCKTQKQRLSAMNADVNINELKDDDLQRLQNDIQHLKEQGISGWEVLFDDKYIHPWASKIYRYPDVIGPALLYVQLRVNGKLKAYPLNFVTRINEQGKYLNVLEPTSLLSAMWYQFLMVLKGDVKIRRCDVCGRWEDMKTHRDNWHRHRSCANAQRVAKSRRKAKETEKE
jgi:ribosomal protein S13